MLPEKEQPESEPLNVPLALMLTTAVDPSMSVPVHVPEMPDSNAGVP
jgi:hypothetical protein